jgi:hypothetical protein
MQSMLTIFTHRVISSESIAKSNKSESIQWAQACLGQEISTDSIRVLATLTEQEDSWEIRNYLEQALTQVGLKFLPIERALHCYIQSFVLAIMNRHEIERSLHSLHDIYLEFDGPAIVRDFESLYWANKSWKENAINKTSYWEGFTFDHRDAICIAVAVKWTKRHGFDYFSIDELLRKTPASTG